MWHLLKKDHISTNVGVHLRYNVISSEFELHDHEFHELVLVLNGKANHYVNGEVYPINGNLLMFVRDKDVHNYEDYLSENFEYYTLAMSYDVTRSLFDFLGNGFDCTPIFSSKLPPKVSLSIQEASSLGNSFSRLFMMMNGDEEKLLTETKMLLVDIFSKYFRTLPKKSEEIPEWLSDAYGKMQLPQNFCEGTEKFFRLCQRSREHCTRELSRYYNTSPSQLVTRLRMSFATSLLSSSNLSVAEIAFRCGYGSLSSFYDSFKRCYGTTPGEFRGSKSIIFT